MTDQETTRREMRQLTAAIVTAYVSHNEMDGAEIAPFIEAVHASLSQLGEAPAAVAAPQAGKPVPAVSIRKSITPEHLVSLEDGRQYKSLKRHLAGRGLTPVQYRAKWGLDLDYPMVAPNYAKRRSDLAKASGLGRKPAEPARKTRRRGTIPA